MSRKRMDLAGKALTFWHVPQSEVKRPGRQQTFIRYISRFLPVGETRRIYFHRELLSDLRKTGSEDETDSVISDALWMTPIPVSLSDIRWLYYDAGDPTIKTRIQLMCKSSPVEKTPCLSLACITPPQDDVFCRGCRQGTSGDTNLQASLGGSFIVPAMTSTPNQSFQSTDPAALNRINELEEQLLALKQQISNIILAQEKMVLPAVPAIQTAPGGPPVCAPPPPPPPPPPCAPPPPPPPPPPPCIKTPQQSISELIKQNKLKKGLSVSDNKDVPSKKGPDMAEVLKGIGKVKLRSIARSPGGTPIREKPRPCDVDDQASLIAQALKRKFAAQRLQDSPDSDKENMGKRTFSPKKNRLSGDGSTPPGPHLLKSNRRAGIRPRVVVPLADVNA